MVDWVAATSWKCGVSGYRSRSVAGLLQKRAESKCLTTEDTEFPNKDAYRAIIALAVCVLESFYESCLGNELNTRGIVSNRSGSQCLSDHVGRLLYDLSLCSLCSLW